MSLLGFMILGGCADRAPGPRSRTAPSLVAWISDLPVPASADTRHLHDTFVEPTGEQHHQGTVEATVQVDSGTFRHLLESADALGYQPVESFQAPYAVPIILAARGGRFRLHGDLSGNYMLAVLNPQSHTVAVQYAHLSGLP